MGRIPLVTGGSTLYLRALRDGLADIPDIPPSVRAHIRKRLDQEGPEALYEILQKVDPRAAATMDATKTQRLARALEVYEATGIPLSRFHETQTPPPYAFRTIVLQRNREELYARASSAVWTRCWRRASWTKYAASSRRDTIPGLNPLRTIGYREPIAFLKGEITEDEMVRLIKQNTRRYAKRQETWFQGGFQSGFRGCGPGFAVASRCGAGCPGSSEANRPYVRDFGAKAGGDSLSVGNLPHETPVCTSSFRNCLRSEVGRGAHFPAIWPESCTLLVRHIPENRIVLRS